MPGSVTARLAALALGTLLAAGCDDNPTAPSRPLTVTLTVAPTSPTVSVDATGSPMIFCQLDMTALAQGDDKAVWEDGVFRWTVGVSRQIPADSQPISAAEMRQLWGGDTIRPGVLMQAGVQVSGTFPFGAELVMRYRTMRTGGTKSLTAKVACVPPGAIDATPLEITSLTVSPNTIEPGDDLEIAYSAKSGVGMWATIIVVSGAVDTVRQTYVEGAQRSITHTMRIRIPARAAAGAPIKVTVYAVDADLHQIERTTSTAPVTDTRAPTLTAAVRDFPFTSPVTPMAGQYAEGDTIHLAVTAIDNSRLRWVVYSVGAPANIRDSIQVADSMLTDFAVNIPVKAGWVGTPGLALYARDVAGLASEPSLSAPAGIRIYPTVTRSTRSNSFDGDFNDVILDERRQLMYVAQGTERRIAVASLQSLAPTAFVALPVNPSGLDLTRSGDSLVVALPDARALAIIDLAQPGYPVTLIPLTAGETGGLRGEPLGVRVAANGKAIVPLLGGLDWTHAQTIEVNFGSGIQRVRADVPTFEIARVSRSGDRSAVVLGGTMWSGNYGQGCGYRYLASSDAFESCQGSASGDLSSSANGDAWINSGALLRADLVYVRSLYVNGVAYFNSALSPDGQLAYLAERARLTVVRTGDRFVIERVPFAPAQRVLVSADGSMLFGFDNPTVGASRVVRINAMTLR